MADDADERQRVIESVIYGKDKSRPVRPEADAPPTAAPGYNRFRGEMAAGLWGKELTSEDAIDSKIKSWEEREREARMEGIQQRRDRGIDIQPEELNYFLPREQQLPTKQTPPQQPAARRPQQAESGPVDPEIASNPAWQSWMAKDPSQWWPRDAQEKVRWRKSLTNQELIEWQKIVKEITYWHLATRNGSQPAYTKNIPAYQEFKKREADLFNRTVPRWRQHEQKNPPRHYRKRSAVEGLGGLNTEEFGVG